MYGALIFSILVEISSYPWESLSFMEWIILSISCVVVFFNLIAELGCLKFCLKYINRSLWIETFFFREFFISFSATDEKYWLKAFAVFWLFLMFLVLILLEVVLLLVSDLTMFHVVLTLLVDFWISESKCIFLQLLLQRTRFYNISYNMLYNLGLYCFCRLHKDCALWYKRFWFQSLTSG